MNESYVRSINSHRRFYMKGLRRRGKGGGTKRLWKQNKNTINKDDAQNLVLLELVIL